MSLTVELVHITVRHRHQIVLDDVSLGLEAGHGLAVAASSSCRATTLLRVIAGLTKPSAGRARLVGDEASRARRRALVGFAPRIQDMNWDGTGAHVLQALGRLKGLSRRQARAETGRWLELLGSERLASRPLSSWPSSALEAFPVAAALLGSPRIVIFDNVVGALHPTVRSRVASVLREVRTQGGAVVLADRDCNAMASICDSIALLSGGQLIGSGSVDEIQDAARGLLHAYAVHDATGLVPDREGVVAKRVGEDLFVLAERDIRQELVDRHGRDVVAARVPTLQETCEWMLQHPERIAARSKLWGRKSSVARTTG